MLGKMLSVAAILSALVMLAFPGPVEAQELLRIMEWHLDSPKKNLSAWVEVDFPEDREVPWRVVLSTIFEVRDTKEFPVGADPAGKKRIDLAYQGQDIDQDYLLAVHLDEFVEGEWREVEQIMHFFYFGDLPSVEMEPENVRIAVPGDHEDLIDVGFWYAAQDSKVRVEYNAKVEASEPDWKIAGNWRNWPMVLSVRGQGYQYKQVRVNSNNNTHHELRMSISDEIIALGLGYSPWFPEETMTNVYYPDEEYEDYEE